MNNRLPTGTMRASIEKRTLNEFEGKMLNEDRMDKVVNARKGYRNSHHSEMLFNCECDDLNCVETISMSPEEYQKVHRKTKYFIVIPSHVRLDLEEIVSSFDSYALVEKLLAPPAV